MRAAEHLSIVIPSARSFPATLVSQLATQLQGADEIIVVCNELHSTAHWILEDVPNPNPTPAQVDARIFIEHAGRCGAAHARNLGWLRSRHEWVLFLDDDIEVGSGLLPQVREAIRDARGAKVITLRVCSRPNACIDLINATISLDRGPEIRRTDNREFKLRDAWMLGVGAAVLAQRQLLSEMGGYKGFLGAGLPNGGAEDLELLWHATKHTSMLYRGDISVLHEDVGSPESIATKFVQYGNAIAHVCAHERSWAGLLLVKDYCAHISSSVYSYIRSTKLPRQRQFWLAAAALRAVSLMSFSYLAGLLLARRNGVLCEKCVAQ